MGKAIVPTKRQDTIKDPVVLAHRFRDTLEIEKPVFKLYTGTHYCEQAKYVKIVFPENLVRKWGNIEIVHITDVQFGHVLCKPERVIEFRDWILEAENRFIAFGGDLVDAWRIGSPGSPYENTSGPNVQVRAFSILWAEAAHRVIGYVGGNHERRACIGFGDLGCLISDILKLPYSAGQQFVDIQFGAAKFRLDLWHGRGTARTKSAKLGMLEKFMLSSDADVCLIGHVHDPIQTYREIRGTDSANLKPTFRLQGGAISSSFLEWIGGYGEVDGMSPMRCKMAKIRLGSNGKWDLTFTHD